MKHPDEWEITPYYSQFPPLPVCLRLLRCRAGSNHWTMKQLAKLKNIKFEKVFTRWLHVLHRYSQGGASENGKISFLDKWVQIGRKKNNSVDFFAIVAIRNGKIKPPKAATARNFVDAAVITVMRWNFEHSSVELNFSFRLRNSVADFHVAKKVY